MNDLLQSSSTTIDRIALIGVTVIGMAMCAPGIGRVAASNQWLSVQGILGTLLGVFILGMVAMRLLGRPLPMIDTDRAALFVVLGVVVIKYAIAAVVPLKAFA